MFYTIAGKGVGMSPFKVLFVEFFLRYTSRVGVSRGSGHKKEVRFTASRGWSNFWVMLTTNVTLFLLHLLSPYLEILHYKLYQNFNELKLRIYSFVPSNRASR